MTLLSAFTKVYRVHFPWIRTYRCSRLLVWIIYCSLSGVLAYISLRPKTFCKIIATHPQRVWADRLQLGVGLFLHLFSWRDGRQSTPCTRETMFPQVQRTNELTPQTPQSQHHGVRLVDDAMVLRGTEQAGIARPYRIAHSHSLYSRWNIAR